MRRNSGKILEKSATVLLAFPFLNRQTKNVWIAITGSSVVTHLLFHAFGILGIAGLIACAVYLVDIRPKILEMLNNRK